jgi:predicted hydrocarbon binding protein
MKKYIDIDLAKESLLGWYPNLDDQQIEYMLDTIPAADVVEVKDCEKCEHFDKHSTQPICICCSNRYTNNFKPKRSDT